MLLGIAFFTFFITHLIFNAYYILSIIACFLFIFSLLLLIYHKVLKKDRTSNALSKNMISSILLGVLLGIGYSIYINQKLRNSSAQEPLTHWQKGVIIQISKSSAVVEYKGQDSYRRVRVSTHIDRSRLSKGMGIHFICNYFFSENTNVFGITQKLQKISQRCKGDIKQVEQYEPSYLQKFRIIIRSELKKRLETFPEGTLAQGFLLADTEKIHPVEMNFFRKMGVAHLFAASGLHLGLIFSIFYLPFMWGRIPKWGEWLGLIVCTLFVILLDFPISLLRAYLFLILYLFLKYMDRRTSPFYIFFFVACLSEIIFPLSTFTYSFLLSFGITACILLGFPFFRKIISFKLPSYLRFVNDHLSLTLSAFTGSVFLSYLLFGFSHVLSLVYNFLLVPFAGIYLFSVLVSMLFSPALTVVSFLDQIFRYSTHLHYLIWEKRFTSINDPFMIFWLSLVAIFLLVCVWFNLDKKLWHVKKYFAVVFSFLVAIYFLQFFFIKAPTEGIKAFPYGVIYYQNKNLYYIGEVAPFIQENKHRFFRRVNFPIHKVYAAYPLTPYVKNFSVSPLEKIYDTTFEKSWGFLKYQKRCFIFVSKKLKLHWMKKKIRQCSRIDLIYPKTLSKLAENLQKKLTQGYPAIKNSKCSFNKWCWSG